MRITNLLKEKTSLTYERHGNLIKKTVATITHQGSIVALSDEHVEFSTLSDKDIDTSSENEIPMAQTYENGNPL